MIHDIQITPRTFRWRVGYAKELELKSKLKKEKQNFRVFVNGAAGATEASFRISKMLLSNKKPFTDGIVVKECLQAAVNVLFPEGSDHRYSSSEIKAAIEDVQLAPSTVVRRCEALNEDLLQQLLSDLQDCDCFSLALDESTDIGDVSQMIVFVRFSKQFIVKEEILTLLPLLNTTSEKNIPLSKLCCVTTDGAPAMTGVHSRLVGLMRKDSDFGKFVSF